MHYLAKIGAPLYAFFHKEFFWHLTNTEESAIHSLCTTLCSHSVLTLPDFTKPFRIESNISETAVGGVFTKEHASVHKPIAFLSKALTSSKKNYNVPDCELLAIITYCKACAPTLMGNKL